LRHAPTRSQPKGTSRWQAKSSANARWSLFFQSQDQAVGWDVWSENTPHGLRDFSPGASASSAMRPPFSATQEFFVSGYLSV
jgi:hypothetical protein